MMEITKQQLAELSNSELEGVAKQIYNIINSRKEQRMKELWGNVKAAIAKYEKEIEPITVRHQTGDIDNMISEISVKAPGTIYII